MSNIFQLDNEMTAFALAGRRLCTITCCNTLMEQVTIYSLLPTDVLSFGRSLVVLQCPRCKRTINLELILGVVSMQEVYTRIKKRHSIDRG